MTERIAYDEFGLFQENATEFDLPWEGRPRVQRRSAVVDPLSGRKMSALVWGSGSPELVLVHGTAQNAHTWDTVALALRRPLVAVDLPGHGHSDWRDDLGYQPALLADDLAAAVAELAPSASGIVGMSLGGLTAMALAARHPHLVRKLVMVDITPGVNRDKAEAIIAFIDGPQTFPDFDAILARTVEHNPTRSEASLRRGILHNAKQLPDGSWQWRYDRRRPQGETTPRADHGALWDELSAVRAPILLVRGGGPGSVVDDADEAELRRIQPDAQVVTVEGAGHSVQGDRPRELTALVERFVWGSGG